MAVYLQEFSTAPASRASTDMWCCVFRLQLQCQVRLLGAPKATGLLRASYGGGLLLSLLRFQWRQFEGINQYLRCLYIWLQLQQELFLLEGVGGEFGTRHVGGTFRWPLQADDKSNILVCVQGVLAGFEATVDRPSSGWRAWG